MKYRPLNVSAAQRGEMKRLLQAPRSLTLCPAAEPHHVTLVVKLFLWLQASRCPSATSTWTFRSLRHHSCSVSREQVLFYLSELHLHPRSLIQPYRWFHFSELKIHFAQRSLFVITQVFAGFCFFFFMLFLFSRLNPTTKAKAITPLPLCNFPGVSV